MLVNRTGDQDREAVPFDGGPSGFLVPDISGTPNSMRAGYPLDTLGLGSGAPQVAGPDKKSPARRDGAWKVGGSNYELFWLVVMVSGAHRGIGMGTLPLRHVRSMRTIRPLPGAQQNNALALRTFRIVRH